MRRGPLAIAAALAIAPAACTLLVDTGGLTGATKPGSDASSADASDAGAESAAPRDAAEADARASYREAVLADNPVAYYRFGEKSGAVAADSSGRGNDAIIAGAAPGAPGAIAGDPDTAFAFSGTAYVQAPASLDFSGRIPFSLEAWASYGANDGNYRRIFEKNRFNDPAGRQGFAIWIETSSGLCFERYVDGTPLTASARPPPPPGVFFHVVATYDGSSLRIYVDGTLRDTVPDARAQAPKTDLPLLLGSSGGGSTWNGPLDELAVYDHVLTPERVALHHDVGVGR